MTVGTLVTNGNMLDKMAEQLLSQVDALREEFNNHISLIYGQNLIGEKEKTDSGSSLNTSYLLREEQLRKKYADMVSYLILHPETSSNLNEGVQKYGGSFFSLFFEFFKEEKNAEVLTQSLGTQNNDLIEKIGSTYLLLENFSHGEVEYKKQFKNALLQRISLMLQEQRKGIDQSIPLYIRGCLEKVKGGESISLHDFSENELGLTISRVSMYKNITAENIDEMFVDSSYSDPRFTLQDWCTIFDAIMHAFPGVNRSFCFEIVQSFLNSLKDENTIFYILKHETTLLGIIGLTQSEESCYVGNFYVNRDFSRFGSGGLLEYFAYQGVGDQPLKAVSLLYDPSSLRHIEKSRGVGKSVVKEVCGTPVSESILELEYSKSMNFWTRTLSQQEYQEHCLSDQEMFGDAIFLTCAINDLEKVCQKYFLQGYFLTRGCIFEEENEINYNLVFEKQNSIKE